jgi:hypothetical protein
MLGYHSTPCDFFEPSRQIASSRERQEWIRWIHGWQSWCVMVTLTFHRQAFRGYITTYPEIERALRHFRRLINCELFNKRRVSKGWTVGFAPTVGMGAYGNHPHAHVLIALPTVASRAALDQSIIRAIRKTRLINREFQISAYLNDGGARYLVEHGTDRMVVPLLTPAWTE